MSGGYGSAAHLPYYISALQSKVVAALLPDPRNKFASETLK
jgi:hypothetical protein